LSARARVRIALEAGRLDHASGCADKGVAHFHDALHEAERAGEEALAVDAAHMLGIVTTLDEQLAWNLRAIEMARRASCAKARRWLGTLYMNTGRTHHDAGRFDDALQMFREAEAWVAAHGRPEQLRRAQWNVGRCLRSLGRADEAMAIQQALLLACDAAGAEDGHVFEELGELLLMKGQRADATAMFRRAHDILAKDAWRLSDEEATALSRKAQDCERSG
jgi:tetratricopeptide (TPR) repeat protein